MYSPKISEDLIPRIHALASNRGIPMTQLVDEILRRALLENDTMPAQEVHEPHTASKYQTFQVSVQLVRNNNSRDPVSLSSPEEVFRFLSPITSKWDREKMLTLLLNTRNHILGVEEVSVGSLTSSIVNPRDLFKSVILSNASGFILAHNHPSGDPSPSQEDRELTKRLKEAGKLMGIELIDHVILAFDRYVSFKESGLL